MLSTGLSAATVIQPSNLGTLIFEDQFERNESQEIKDEPGNEWTTSSEKTANGNKQVDLKDGAMYIVTHPKANHAASVRHTFPAFKDGTLELKFKLENKNDSLKLNFTDLAEKSVHAGHLFNVTVSLTQVACEDLKTGVMNQSIRKARKAKTLSAENSSNLKTKKSSRKISLKQGEWNHVAATIRGDEVTVNLNGKNVLTFRSPGFAHKTKTMIRLLPPKRVVVDDIRVWRQN